MREQERLLQSELPLARAQKTEWFAALFLCALLVVRLPIRDPAGGFEFLVLPQEFAVGLFAFLLLALAVWARLSISLDGIAGCLAVLAGVELGSLAQAPNGWVGLRSSGLWLSGLIVFAVGRAVANLARGRLSLTPLLLPVLLLATSVIAEALGLWRGLSNSGHAPGGLLAQRNAASELLVCCLPLVVFAAVKLEQRAVRAAANVLAAATVVALLLSRTRSAWLALLALSLLGLFLAARKTLDPIARRRAAWLVAGAAVALSLTPHLPIRLHWKSATPYRQTLAQLFDRGSGSGAGRLIQYGTTLKMAALHPGLGAGPGNWAGQYPSVAASDDPTMGEGFRPTNRLPNSDHLGFLAERGVLGALALAALGFLLVRERGEARWLLRGTLLALAVVGALDAVLQWPVPVAVLAWMLGLSSAPAPSTVAMGKVPGILGAVGLALLGISLVMAARRTYSFALAANPHGLEDLERAARLDPGEVARRLQLAEAWINNGDCSRARPHLEAALHYAPDSPGVRALRARCP